MPIVYCTIELISRAQFLWLGDYPQKTAKIGPLEISHYTVLILEYAKHMSKFEGRNKTRAGSIS